MKNWRYLPAVSGLLLLGMVGSSVEAQESPLFDDANNPGIIEPVQTAISGAAVRIPNTDQSVDGLEQNLIVGDVLYQNANETTSLLGHSITRVESPNVDMRNSLESMLAHAQNGDRDAMKSSARDLIDILLGTTEGRIYDGFSMLNFNRWKDPRIGAQHFPADAVSGEYKLKWARDTGETADSYGSQRRIWQVDINMLYYDGQIDSDTFLLAFPFGHHADDLLRVNYRIYSLVREDFSPTLVMLDKRLAQNTVSFPFKGLDSVWVPFERGQVLNLTVDYPPVRQVRGVYTWGWRRHPPRIQFLQPVYEIENQNTRAIEWDPQSASFTYRNREELTLDAIGDAAPEMKMYDVAMAALSGASPSQIEKQLTIATQGPRGTLYEWADLALEQRQLPPEVWDLLALEGIRPGEHGDYDMISVFLNNEMYGEGRWENEVVGWDQGDTFKVKLINLDDHTHYFRNVDFGTRLNDDILRCCGGGQTSFEVMNFKPSYGAPKVAEMQWRAGWGFRPHWDVIQQQEVFSRASDRVKLKPFWGGFDGLFYGYQYSEEARGGDFRFNPPPFIIKDVGHESPFLLRDADGKPGLVIGQLTEGYGVGQFCPEDPFPGFCQSDLAPFNPNGAKNWPEPNNPEVEKTELRFPPFLRNPLQGDERAGDIIPPTGAWDPFLYYSPHNGTLFNDPADPSKGFWVDQTFAHGSTVYAGQQLNASIELPRASGQVFYQFDDLYHDNSIFSPHPLFEGDDEEDRVLNLAANLRGSSVRARGRVSRLDSGKFAAWVTVVSGTMGDFGCSGTLLGVAEVNQKSGTFVFRKQLDSPLASNTSICVQSIVGGLKATVAR